MCIRGDMRPFLAVAAASILSGCHLGDMSKGMRTSYIRGCQEEDKRGMGGVGRGGE